MVPRVPTPIQNTNTPPSRLLSRRYVPFFALTASIDSPVLLQLFNLPNFLTKRDAWAGTFEHAISLDKPREDCPVTLSEPPAPAENNTNNKFGKSFTA